MRTRLGLLLGFLLLTGPLPVQAEDGVKLFKIITAKDEIVIGLTAAELQALGSGPDIDKLGKHLAADGQMAVWQYAVRKDNSGNLQQAPSKRIVVFRTDTLRLEPYASPLTVVPPDK